MLKSKKFTIVVPAVFATLVAASAAQAGISIPFIGGKAADQAVSKAAAALAKDGENNLDGVTKFFRSSATARFVMTNTSQGKAIMSQLLSTPSTDIRGVTYDSFLQHINWGENRAIRNELYMKLRKLDDDFLKYRQKKGIQGKFDYSTALLPEEVRYLETRSSQMIKEEQFQALFNKKQDFVSVPRQGYARTREDLEVVPATTIDSKLPTKIEVPPTAANVLNTDIVGKTGGWIARKGRAVDNLFKFIRFSSGEWQTLLGFEGRTFTVEEATLLRKVNRLLGTLNDYSKARLTLEAFTLESPEAYNQLNAATDQATQRFLDGQISATSYLKARALAMKNLDLSPVVNDAESKMIETISQAKLLGGTERGDLGLVPTKEKELLVEEQNRADAEQQVIEIKRQLSVAPSEGEAARLEIDLASAESSRDLAASRISTSQDQLKELYWQFIQNYEPLGIFANLRRGLLNDDPVPKFDLPDSMVVSQNEIDHWSEIYDRALVNSTDKIVLSESAQFFKARAFATRKFINDLNNSTGKFFGTKFTQSQYGTEFKKYADGIVLDLTKKILMYVGAPTAVIESPKIASWVSDKVGEGLGLVFDKDSAPGKPKPKPAPSPTPSTPPKNTKVNPSEAPDPSTYQNQRGKPINF